MQPIATAESTYGLLSYNPLRRPESDRKEHHNGDGQDVIGGVGRRRAFPTALVLRSNRRQRRRLVLRMYWDGEETPSVVSPIGNFFGLGHAAPAYFRSLPLQASYLGLNYGFSMPYSTGTRITMTNDSDTDTRLYFYVDYQELERPQEGMGRFHVEDPIYFEISLLFSIEHGHANNKQGDWTSTAYLVPDWAERAVARGPTVCGASTVRLRRAGVEARPGQARACLDEGLALP